MLKKITKILKKNNEITTLSLFIIASLIFISLFNYKKNIDNKNFNNLINNLYLKKTLNHIFDNLEPKYKRVNHKIRPGETFDKILKIYLIEDQEIKKIKKNLSKKIDLNKLNTKQIISFSLDQSNNQIKEFIFQISNTEKIYLKKDINDLFNQETVNEYYM